MLRTTCVIAGCGPAGAMLGLLLARAGVPVVVLEKHGDFLRDFRGDTIHPSTMRLLDELGLGTEFRALPLQEVERLVVTTDDGDFDVADFSRLRGRHRALGFLPQWDFLDFVTRHAAAEPGFTLLLGAEVTGLVRDGDRVVGVTYRSGGVEGEVRADLTVATDGRRSVLREAAGLRARRFGAPMDVVWFRLSRKATDPARTAARLAAGRLMIRINRGSYWQTAFLIPKGGYAALQDRGLAAFRAEMAGLEPFLADRTDELAGWDDVSVLDVVVDRLPRWHRPGFLALGDAAHAMSPIGGVGINLAVQDAVAAANRLAGPLREGRLTEADLAAVQRRRRPATVVVQAAQRFAQDRYLAGLVAGTAGAGTPPPLRLLHRFPRLQVVPAYLIGIGVRPEHVRTAGPARTAGPPGEDGPAGGVTGSRPPSPPR